MARRRGPARRSSERVRRTRRADRGRFARRRPSLSYTSRPASGSTRGWWASGRVTAVANDQMRRMPLPSRFSTARGSTQRPNRLSLVGPLAGLAGPADKTANTRTPRSDMRRRGRSPQSGPPTSQPLSGHYHVLRQRGRRDSTMWNVAPRVSGCNHWLAAVAPAVLFHQRFADMSTPKRCIYHPHVVHSWLQDQRRTR